MATGFINRCKPNTVNMLRNLISIEVSIEGGGERGMRDASVVTSDANTFSFFLSFFLVQLAYINTKHPDFTYTVSGVSRASIKSEAESLAQAASSHYLSPPFLLLSRRSSASVAPVRYAADRKVSFLKIDTLSIVALTPLSPLSPLDGPSTAGVAGWQR